jgi:hypothetical protein
LIDEGEREHAYELAPFESLVDTVSMKPLPRTNYSERHAWLSKSFDPLLMTLAHARLIKPTRLFIETLAGGLDGRRALAHASVVRRYMANCDTWVSSYRLVLAMVQEFDVPAVFQASDLASGDIDNAPDAKWDLFFVRIGGLQEYGFHAGLEDLIWATDGLGDALALLDWSAIQALLPKKKTEWMEIIIRHAQAGGAFFADRRVDEETPEPDLA